MVGFLGDSIVNSSVKEQALLMIGVKLNVLSLLLSLSIS